MTARQFYYQVWLKSPNKPKLREDPTMSFAEAYARFYGERLLQAEMKLLEFGIFWEEGKGYVFNGKDETPSPPSKERE